MGETKSGIELPHGLNLSERDFESEPRPPGGGVECFDTPAARELNRARLDHVQSLELAWNGKSVLDVGCGVGHLAQFFAEKGCRVVGVDGRAENIGSLRNRYPGLEAHVADVEGDLSGLGVFDIVLAYGLLYHLENPVLGLRNIAAVCRELLLLETVVCDHRLPLVLWDDETKSCSQALRGVGCRPTPAFVTMMLKRVGFPFLYAPAAPPQHSDFQVEWQDNLAWERDGHLLRCVFVASRKHLANPNLIPLYKAAGDRLREAYEIGEPIKDALSLSELVLHNSAEAVEGDPLTVVTPPDQWAYAASFPLHRTSLNGAATSKSLLVRIEISVEEGAIGAGGVTEDLQAFVGEEAVVSAQDARQGIEVLIEDGHRCGWLILRNSAPGGTRSRVRIHGLRVNAARRRPGRDLAEGPARQIQNLLSNEPAAPPLILSSGRTK